MSPSEERNKREYQEQDRGLESYGEPDGYDDTDDEAAECCECPSRYHGIAESTSDGCWSLAWTSFHLVASTLGEHTCSQVAKPMASTNSPWSLVLQKEADPRETSHREPLAALNWSPLTLRPSKRSATRRLLGR
jgi:hypothetical protein